MPFRKKNKEVEIYDEYGEFVGKGHIVTNNKKIVGLYIKKEGKRFFEPADNIEVLDFGVVVLPKDLRNIPKIKENSNNEEIMAYYTKIKNKIITLQKMEENLLMESAKLVGRRMIGDIAFMEYSKKFKEIDKRYKIISKLLNRYVQIVDDLKERMK